jgi:hypothetical protein
MWDAVRGSASDACLPLPKPEKLHLEPLLLPRHDCLPTAIQMHNHILEPTSAQPKNIDDINTAITTTLESPITHQLNPAHRIDRARPQ